MIRKIFLVLLTTIAFAFVGLAAQASTTSHYRHAEHVSAQAASSAGPSSSGSVSGTRKEGANSCPWAFSWHVRSPLTGHAYGGVEWTTNPCGFLIQARIGCTNIYEHHYIPKWSGEVRGTGIWDNSYCSASADSIDWLQRHIRFGPSGSPWYPWRNVWGSGP